MDKLRDLITKFENNIQDINDPTSPFTEMDTRVEYIDKFLQILEWDVNNLQGKNIRLKEVKRDNLEKDGDDNTFPDYMFSLNSKKKFCLEAKKVSENIDKKKWVFQVRSYGYNSRLPISVLTNFKELRIYDTNHEPFEHDDTNKGLLAKFEYKEFAENFSKIEEFLGKTKVNEPEWNNKVNLKFDARPTLDIKFIEKINNWRILIAEDIIKLDQNIDHKKLNLYTQQVLNRILFIRMCEDKKIFDNLELKNCTDDENSEKLINIFKEYNKKFNTKIFKLENEIYDEQYSLRNSNLGEIIKELYPPFSPYNFSIFSAEFFADIYEEYLRKYLNKINGKVILKEKQDYENKDIVSTPRYLIDEIISNSLEEVKNLENLRILDPATGSGKFLISAYDFLLSKFYHTVEEKINLKKNILGCLYAIDNDYLAIDTAKFSLYMKVLEDESKETLINLKNILPDLNNNIALGNSIVDTDFGDNHENILPFSWLNFFGEEKFNFILCNPPYEETKAIRKNIDEFYYVRNKYKSAFKQFDKYFLFIEKSLNHLKENGQLGFLIPNKWITIGASKKLRKLLEKKITSITNFGSIQMFEGRSTYVCILSVKNKVNEELTYEYVNDINEWIAGKRNKIKFNQSKINYNKPLILPQNLNQKEIIHKIHKNCEYLNKDRILGGIQTSKDEIYVIQNYKEIDDYIFFTKDEKEWKLEKKILKPYIDKKENIHSFEEVKQDSFIIYPYEDIENTQSLIKIEKMKNLFPNTLKYLLNYKDILLSRNFSPPLENDNEFYKYGRSQNLSYINVKPKILYAINQQHGDKYGLDNLGLVFAQGGTAGALSIIDLYGECSIYFILGLLGQKEIELFFKLRSSEFQGNAFARGNDVILDLPIPKTNTDEKKQIHDEIAGKVKEIFLINGSSSLNSEEKKTKINFINDKIRYQFKKLWE